MFWSNKKKSEIDLFKFNRVLGSKYCYKFPLAGGHFQIIYKCKELGLNYNADLNLDLITFYDNESDAAFQFYFSEQL